MIVLQHSLSMICFIYKMSCQLEINRLIVGGGRLKGTGMSACVTLTDRGRISKAITNTVAAVKSFFQASVHSYDVTTWGSTRGKVMSLGSNSEAGMYCKAAGIRPQRGRGYTLIMTWWSRPMGMDQLAAGHSYRGLKAVWAWRHHRCEFNTQQDETNRLSLSFFSSINNFISCNVRGKNQYIKLYFPFTLILIHLTFKWTAVLLR